jgi:hypothetical protein
MVGAYEASEETNDLDKINEGWAATEENRNEDAFMIDRKTARARRRKSILEALEAVREEP